MQGKGEEQHRDVICHPVEFNPGTRLSHRAAMAQLPEHQQTPMEKSPWPHAGALHCRHNTKPELETPWEQITLSDASCRGRVAPSVGWGPLTSRASPQNAALNFTMRLERTCSTLLTSTAMFY